jgi:hypothetical protein
MKELTPGKIEALKRSAAGQQGKFQIADFRFQIQAINDICPPKGGLYEKMPT